MPVFIRFVFITYVRTQIGKLALAQTDLLDMIRSRRGSDRPRLNGKPRDIRRAAHAHLTIEYDHTVDLILVHWAHRYSYVARDASTCTPASDATRGAVCTDWRRAFAAKALDRRPPRPRCRACPKSPQTRACRRHPLSPRGYARRWLPSTACARPWHRRMLSRGCAVATLGAANHVEGVIAVGVATSSLATKA